MLRVLERARPYKGAVHIARQCFATRSPRRTRLSGNGRCLPSAKAETPHEGSGWRYRSARDYPYHTARHSAATRGYATLTSLITVSFSIVVPLNHCHTRERCVSSQSVMISISPTLGLSLYTHVSSIVFSPDSQAWPLMRSVSK